MGTHPNAILQLTLKPDGLTRKTARAIRDDVGAPGDDDQIKIAGAEYHVIVFEGDYDEGMQIAADVGDIALVDMITYGYGESIPWEKLEAQKNELEAWAKVICEKHQCTFKISVTANYW